MPGDDIATDDIAFQHYNAAVESWGDRLSAAGMRLSCFYLALKMPGATVCPSAGRK